jgi:hypothetical protein
MSQQFPEASSNTDDDWGTRLQKSARHFDYPPTPDVTRKVLSRISFRRAYPWRLATQMLLLFLLLLSSFMMVPEIRARLTEILQIGVVQIFVGAADPTGTPLPTVLPSILDLPGEMSLEQAQNKVTFPIHLPANLRPPDRVFVPEFQGPVQNSGGVILVWIDEIQRNRVEFILYQFSNISNEIIFNKFIDHNLENTQVNGNPAVWAQGPHMLYMFYDEREYPEIGRIVTQSVLIWSQDEITYRLETTLPLEAALKLAETLP